MQLQRGVLQQLAGFVGGDAVGTPTPAQISDAIVVAVADIDAPVEFGALIGGTQGELRIAVEADASGNMMATLYCWDTAGTSGASPRVVASTGGSWVAIGGRWTATPAYGPAVVALTDAANIATNAALGFTFSVTLGGNRTLANPTGLVAGATYQWIITQDGVGGRTLAYGALFTWPGGAVPVVGAAIGAVSVISAVYDGTALRAVMQASFA